MDKKTRFKIALLSLVIVTGFSFYAVAKDMESLASQGLAAIMIIVPVFIAGDTLRKSEASVSRLPDPRKLKSNQEEGELEETVIEEEVIRPRYKIEGGKRIEI